MPLISHRFHYALAVAGAVLLLHGVTSQAAHSHKISTHAMAGSHKGSARSAIEACYALYAKSLKTKDFATMMKMEAPDFVHKRGKLTQTRSQADATFRQQLAQLTNIQDARVTLKQINIQGNQATVEAHQELKATFKDPAGKLHKLVSSGDSHDVWIKKPQGWLIQSTADLKAATTIDGKAM